MLTIPKALHARQNVTSDRRCIYWLAPTVHLTYISQQTCAGAHADARVQLGCNGPQCTGCALANMQHETISLIIFDAVHLQRCCASLVCSSALPTRSADTRLIMMQTVLHTAPRLGAASAAALRCMQQVEPQCSVSVELWIMRAALPHIACCVCPSLYLIHSRVTSTCNDCQSVPQLWLGHCHVAMLRAANGEISGDPSSNRVGRTVP